LAGPRSLLQRVEEEAEEKKERKNDEQVCTQAMFGIPKRSWLSGSTLSALEAGEEARRKLRLDETPDKNTEQERCKQCFRQKGADAARLSRLG
jgi:hypothetical protein